mmetsp:Transcript_23655/g.33206  ORF Transcript_23655/g.33206 Transcript_23655/m.33206 type:complete len:416 (+) Transcript_23655:324-1571(+)
MEWSSIPVGPEDAVFKVNRLFNECQNPKKVSLGIGAYRNEEGKPLVLEAVIQAKADLASQPSQEWTHEYQPIDGCQNFVRAAQDLAFGPTLRKQLGDCLVGMQTMSGTGACRLGFEFVSRYGTHTDTILLPNPTWGNHKSIAKFARLKILEYTYLDETQMETPKLDLPQILKDLHSAPKGTTVVLHMCAHNPTGVDPTMEEWEQIADVIKERELQPFFDNAYQGFASGDLEGDAASLRLFIDKGLHPLVACSFAKNMGLYGERIGALHVVAPSPEAAQATLSQLKIEARAMYSNPPKFGAQVALRVMTNPKLRPLWETELKHMSERIKRMRVVLRKLLEDKVNPAHGKTWNHVTDQIGMFSYTGLTPDQVNHCGTEGSVFMLSTGRISMAGLNDHNVEYVATVMANAIDAYPSSK